MSRIYFGERELIVETAPFNRLINCKEEGFEKGSDIEMLWRNQTLKREVLAFLDPPDPIKAIKPRPDRLVLFSKEPTKPWKAWGAQHSIDMAACWHPAPELFTALLVSGHAGVALTQDAAEWYVRMVGTSTKRLKNELLKFVAGGHTKANLETTILLVGGSEELKAEHLLKALGTAKGCRLALEVPEKRAMQLLHPTNGYFARSLGNRRNSWPAALQAVHEGVINVTLKPWSAVQIFAQYCYETKSGGKPEADAYVELLEACGLWEPLGEVAA